MSDTPNNNNTPQTDDASRFMSIGGGNQSQQPEAQPAQSDDANRFLQVGAGQQQQDQLAQQQPQPPSFVERLWEGSGAKALWEQSRQQYAADAAVRDQAIQQLKAHDFGGAVETIGKHIAKRAGEAALGPAGSIVSGIAQNTYQHGKAAVQAAQAGDTGSAIENTAEAVPLVGPAVEQFAKPLGEDLGTRNYKGAAGDVAGALVQLLLAKGLGGAGDAEEGAAAAKSALPEVSSDAVKAQVVKDAIRKSLGNKADATVIDEAYARLNPQNIWDKAVSPVENELKLVKPKLNADTNVLNKRLDTVLADSGATVDGAASSLNEAFDQLKAKAKAGVGDPAEADAIDAVRKRVLPKLTDEPMDVVELNNLKRTVGDQIKNFQPPEMLNSAQRMEQEAYRQSYFKLRDLVSDAVPESKDLNMKLSRAFDLSDLLDKKFPQLETPEQAVASYQGVRKQGVKSVAKKAALATGAAYEGKRILNSLTGGDDH